jgi:hypothetical protein
MPLQWRIATASLDLTWWICPRNSTQLLIIKHKTKVLPTSLTVVQPYVQQRNKAKCDSFDSSTTQSNEAAKPRVSYTCIKRYGMRLGAVLSSIKPASALYTSNRLENISRHPALVGLLSYLLVDTLPAILALLGVLDNRFGRGKLPQMGKSI